jgi:hypothetical protein
LNSPKDRLEHMKILTKEFGVEIEPFELTPRLYMEQKIELRQRLNQCPQIVPVMFYEKIDNHDINYDEFLKNIGGYLDEINQIIIKLHTLGIEEIYIISDHGFLFLEEDKLIKEIPQGIVHKRHAISPKLLTEDEKSNYRDWLFFPIDHFGYEADYSTNAIKTIIVPKNYGLFKKPRNNSTFYIHGGISYQECDLLYLRSQCILKPEVQIESIEISDHEKLTAGQGKELYVLKEMGDMKYLQVQIVTKKKEDKGEPLRPLTIKMTCADPQIQIEPNQDVSFQSGQKRNFKCKWSKAYRISTIELQLKNADNEIFDKKTFNLSEPSIYGSGDLF